MRDVLRNRLNMFDAALNVLNADENKPVWHNQPPTLFTTLVAEAEAALAELDALAQAQTTDITGVAADKDQEERELEDVCIKYGRTVALCYRRLGDDTNAAKVDLSPSRWRKLAERDLLITSRLLRDLMQSLLDTSPADAAACAITADAVASVTKESDDFAAVLTDPQAARATRKAMTAALRPKIRALSAKFDDLDDLIRHFDATEAGVAMIAAYHNARNIIDSGGSPAPSPGGGHAPGPSESSSSSSSSGS